MSKAEHGSRLLDLLGDGNTVIPVILCGLFLCIGVSIGGVITDARWERECAKRGVASYDVTTGEWQWRPEFLTAEELEAAARQTLTRETGSDQHK